MPHVDIVGFINRFMVTITRMVATCTRIRHFRDFILTLILYTRIETIVVIEIFMLCRIKLFQRAVEFLAKTSNILSERLEFISKEVLMRDKL